MNFFGTRNSYLKNVNKKLNSFAHGAPSMYPTTFKLYWLASNMYPMKLCCWCILLLWFGWYPCNSYILWFKRPWSSYICIIMILIIFMIHIGIVWLVLICSFDRILYSYWNSCSWTCTNKWNKNFNFRALDLFKGILNKRNVLEYLE